MQLIDETTLTTLRKAAAPQSCRLVDFETAEVRPGFVPNTLFLIVSGTVPCANMRVELIPVVYIQRPDYWEIEVVAFLPGPICLPQVGKYTENNSARRHSGHRRHRGRRRNAQGAYPRVSSRSRASGLTMTSAETLLGPDSREPDPDQSVKARQPKATPMRTFKDMELVPKCEDLELQDCARTTAISKCRQEDAED
jgi:hypothetical protein